MRTYVLLGALVLGGMGCVPTDESSGATATRISSPNDFIGGSKALGTIGDYRIENEHIRFIVQGPGLSRVANPYAGTIVDADIKRPSSQEGNDQLGELLSLFAFETLKPIEYQIESDGQNGGPAILTVQGKSADLIEQIALLNRALLFSTNLDCKVQYKLEPGSHYLDISTTITNASDGVHTFPFLDPADLKAAGLDVGGIDEVELSSPLGAGLLSGGDQKLFAPGPSGMELYFALEDAFETSPGLPAFPGLVVPYMATFGDGVSYGFTATPSQDNYVDQLADYYGSKSFLPGQNMVVPFTFSGLVGMYHTMPPKSLAPQESFTYDFRFYVGHGDVASVSDHIFAEAGIDLGTFSGEVIDAQTEQPVEGAMVFIKDENQHYITEATTQKNGSFKARLPAGNYTYVVQYEPYETTKEKSISIAVKSDSAEKILLTPPGTLGVTVIDEQGRHLPSTLTLVGMFAADKLQSKPRDFLYDLTIGERWRPVTLEEGRRDFIEEQWTTKDGLSTKTVEPGTYDLVVSRGIEYDTTTVPVTIVSGGFTTKEIVLNKVIESDGYILGDMHLHTKNSSDSNVTLEDRVISVAAAGVEYAVATDHNYLSDYSQAIHNAGLEEWMSSSIGSEVTTFEMGHFNGYPLKHDSSSPRGGEISWFNETPQAIFDQIRALGSLGPDDTIIQVNHPRWDVIGYNAAFNLDQDTGQPAPKKGLRSVLSPAGSNYALEEFSYDFDTIELMTGKANYILHSYRVPEELPPPPLPEDIPPAGTILRNEDGDVVYPGVVEDWFSLLNNGHQVTGVGSSDSHGPGTPVGAPATYIWVGEGKSKVGQFTEKDVVFGLKNGRSMVSMGPYVQASVDGQTVGSTVTNIEGRATLNIEVRSANWSPFEKVLVYKNGDVVHTFNVPEENKHLFKADVDIEITEDSWLVVEVEGSQNLFPVVCPEEIPPLSPTSIIAGIGDSLDFSEFLSPTGNLSPTLVHPVTPWAMTNPIYIDADGDGQYGRSRASSTKDKGNRNVSSDDVEKLEPHIDVVQMFDEMTESQDGHQSR